jgi:hypothetical protein
MSRRTLKAQQVAGISGMPAIGGTGLLTSSIRATTSTSLVIADNACFVDFAADLNVTDEVPVAVTQLRSWNLDFAGGGTNSLSETSELEHIVSVGWKELCSESES